jgi:hypothetical protein
MKRISFVIISILFFSFCSQADEICDEALVEGKQRYNEGNYKEAKELFEYVKNDCGANYGDVSTWINKCYAALTPTLSVSKYLVSCSAEATTQYLTVKSNTSWQIERPTGTMYSVTKNGNTLTVRINANTSTAAREDYFNVKTTDGKIVKKITLKQSGKIISNSSTSSTKTTSSSSASTTTTLSVSSTYIYSSYSGSTRYLTVTSNTEWELLYPTGSMYSVSRSGNQLTVYIHSNSYNESRKDFFKVRTKNGAKEIKITMEQGANTSAKKKTTSKAKKTTSYNNGLSAYQKYVQNQGDIEITWVGLNTSICTGYSFGWSLFRLRFGWFQLQPYEMNAGYDFVTGSGFVTYNPSANFLIPTDYDGTFYFGAGPTITTSEYFDVVWFNTELGYRWHWGDWASSDFFMRYDGAFTIGLSIQWSSYF